MSAEEPEGAAPARPSAGNDDAPLDAASNNRGTNASQPVLPPSPGDEGEELPEKTPQTVHSHRINLITLVPLDLIFVVFLSILALSGIVALEDGHPARLLFASIFLLFLPGYSAVSAIWPEKQANNPSGKDDENMQPPGVSVPERIALSFGLSIGISAISALALSFLWEITIQSVTISLFSITAGLSLLAWLLRYRLPEDRRFTAAIHHPLSSRFQSPLSFADKMFALMVIAALVIGAGAVAYVAKTVDDVEPYTEFYILDENGTLQNLPNNIGVGEFAAIQLCVSNHESVPVSYNVVAILRNEAGAAIKTITNYNITLDDGGSHTGNIAFNVTSSGNFRMETFLYRSGVPGTYLSASLWITVV